MQKIFTIFLVVCSTFLNIFGTPDKNSVISLKNSISYFGPTGLINIPSTHTLEDNKFNLGFHQRYTFKMNYGVPTFFLPPVEIGIKIELGEQKTFQERLEKTIVNLKCQIFEQKNFGIATGITQYKPYLIISEYFYLTEIYLGVGINYNNPSSFRKHKERLNGIFGGMTKFLSSSSIIIIEYDSFALNLGFRFLLSPTWKIDLLITDLLTQRKFDYSNISPGISYYR